MYSSECRWGPLVSRGAPISAQFSSAIEAVKGDVLSSGRGRLFAHRGRLFAQADQLLLLCLARVLTSDQSELHDVPDNDGHNPVRLVYLMTEEAARDLFRMYARLTVSRGAGSVVTKSLRIRQRLNC